MLHDVRATRRDEAEQVRFQFGIALEAAERAEDRGWKMSESLNEGYKKTLAEKGITVLPATAKMKEEVKAIGETMAKEWAAKAGPDGEKLIADFKK